MRSDLGTVLVIVLRLEVGLFLYFFTKILGVEHLRTTKKDHTSLAELAWWFDGCISYLRTSVHPPLKMSSFEKMTLRLNEPNFSGGLTSRCNFEN